MKALVTAALLLAAGTGAGQPAPQGQWTWSLYEHDKSVTLANEIPDTDSIGAVFECDKGSGQARLSVYPDGARRPEDRFTVPVGIRDALFADFLKTGRMVVRSEERIATILLSPDHRRDLQRFAALCGR
jgi:hypothetical protein